ncbi:MAG: hypothetical protein ACQESN_08710 [Thermotogota bacterium]
MEKEYKISEKKVNELLQYLSDVPFKYASNIIKFLKQNLIEINQKEVKKNIDNNKDKK